MARALTVLTAFVVLVLGAAGAADESVLLAGLLGMAVWLVGELAAAARPGGGGAGPAPAVRGHRYRHRVAAARQWDPDAAGRMRARAPAVRAAA